MQINNLTAINSNLSINNLKLNSNKIQFDNDDITKNNLSSNFMENFWLRVQDIFLITKVLTLMN